MSTFLVYLNENDNVEWKNDKLPCTMIMEKEGFGKGIMNEA